jgi:hypothetical protein
LIDRGVEVANTVRLTNSSAPKSSMSVEGRATSSGTFFARQQRRSRWLRSTAAKEGILTKELWLRVHDDGREECYNHDPAPIPALHIVVTDGVEETWTSDRAVRPGWREPVPPPGKGWKAAGGDGHSTLWRRVTTGVEEMWTSDREVRPGWREPVPPSGEGWKAAGGDGHSTLWRRTRLEL